MKLLRTIVTPLLFLLTDACIDPIEVGVVSQKPKLVVDGLVTNDPGPYRVKLFYSRDANISSKDAVPVRDASVFIIEDGSIVRPLTLVSDGIYETDDGWQAQTGKSYAVRIITGDLKTYGSQPQVLLPPGAIDSIYTKFESNGIALLDDGSLLQDAVDVSIDARAGTETAYLRWRFIGIYHAHTYPQFRLRGFPGGMVIPDPPPCSGYINYFDELIRVGECTCCDCWPIEYNNSVLLSSAQLTRGAAFKNAFITKIPVTPLRMINRYRVEIEQLSVSEEIYNFWKLVKIQQESAGSIFQPTAVKVRGNIFPEDGDEEVLGIFAVSGITRKSVFIEPSLIPYTIIADTLVSECKQSFPNATDKPSYWP